MHSSDFIRAFLSNRNFILVLEHQACHSVLSSRLSQLNGIHDSKQNLERASSLNQHFNDNELYIYDTSKAWYMLKSGESYSEEAELLIYKLGQRSSYINEEEVNNVISFPSHNIDYISVRF